MLHATAHCSNPSHGLSRSHRRAVVTRNWNDYVAIHEEGVRHEGIFVCRGDEAQLQVADAIHELAKNRPHLTQQLFRIMG